MKKLTQLVLASLVIGSLILNGIGCSSDQSSSNNDANKVETETKSDY